MKGGKLSCSHTNEQPATLCSIAFLARSSCAVAILDLLDNPSIYGHRFLLAWPRLDAILNKFLGITAEVHLATPRAVKFCH